MLELFLAQVRAADTNPAALVVPDMDQLLVVSSVVMCNVSGAAAAYALYHDNDGSVPVLDESTALVWWATLDPGETAALAFKIVMGGVGTLAYQSDTANGITCTCYGFEV